MLQETEHYDWLAGQTCVLITVITTDPDLPTQTRWTLQTPTHQQTSRQYREEDVFVCMSAVRIVILTTSQTLNLSFSRDALSFPELILIVIISSSVISEIINTNDIPHIPTECNVFTKQV